MAWVFSKVGADDLAHHGIFAHEHNSLPPKSHADLLELLRPNVVTRHDEDSRVRIKEALHLAKILLLALP